MSIPTNSGSMTIRVKFFYGTPIMSIIDFLARSCSLLLNQYYLLEDTKPLMHPQAQ